MDLWASKLAQQIDALAAKLGDLSLIPGAHNEKAASYKLASDFHMYTDILNKCNF